MTRKNAQPRANSKSPREERVTRKFNCNDEFSHEILNGENLEIEAVKQRPIRDLNIWEEVTGIAHNVIDNKIVFENFQIILPLSELENTSITSLTGKRVSIVRTDRIENPFIVRILDSPELDGHPLGLLSAHKR